MKFPNVRSHFKISGPTYEQTIVFIISLGILFFAISSVFYGFIGYYSRVVLISEFEKENKEANIDYIFMQIDQLERDEVNLNSLRSSLANLTRQISAERGKIMEVAISSHEYEEYVTSAMAVIDEFYAARDLLSDEYWSEINRIDYNQPALLQADLFSNPIYKESIDLQKKADLFRQIGAAIQNFRYKIVYYNTKYGGPISQIGSAEKAEMDNLRSTVRQVLTRNPQLATADEVSTYNLGGFALSADQEQRIAQHRAVVASYRNALGAASVILQWPTIVSTMVVTLATGLLAGVVSFMGASVRSKGPDGPNVRLQVIGLLRRSVFGVIAAFAIFLLAGSGLLVLTAQSSRLVSPGSIELSPYFVAFLAFISGFLADEAFERIAKTGRTILQTSDARKAPAPPSKQGPPANSAPRR
jgi:hypothetical protein